MKPLLYNVNAADLQRARGHQVSGMARKEGGERKSSTAFSKAGHLEAAVDSLLG